MNKRMKLLVIPLAAISLSSCGPSEANGVNTTIQMRTGFGQSMTTQLETILETYSSEHPGIDVVHTGQGGYDNLLAAIVGSVSTTVAGIGELLLFKLVLTEEAVIPLE